jgi:hypothetical protein
VEAVAPEPDPVVVPPPEPDVPLLDPEVLAILGLAAHRAGLDALESLEELPPARPAADDGPIRKKPRPERERTTQTRLQRREAKASRKKLPKQERPAQDEWGVFDPAQCGPAALFDDEEWDEDNDDRPSRSRASTH